MSGARLLSSTMPSDWKRSGAAAGRTPSATLPTVPFFQRPELGVVSGGARQVGDHGTSVADQLVFAGRSSCWANARAGHGEELGVERELDFAQGLRDGRRRDVRLSCSAARARFLCSSSAKRSCKCL